ncbi:MAG TPA: response regulator [Bacteroidales bacterium]|nr:response regulator [Bacteroidales bacterium]
MTDKPLILYVDDEFINLKLFEVKFGSSYNIITAAEGDKGLELISSFPGVRIVISDMKMPGMNGIEFITRARERVPKADFFLITGYELNDEISCACKSGLIRKFFCKPINFNEISFEICEALNS